MSLEKLTEYQLGRRAGRWEGTPEALRRENEDLRTKNAVWAKQVARLLRGLEQLREENRRLRDELADARRMHGGDDPAA